MLNNQNLFPTTIFFSKFKKNKLATKQIKKGIIVIVEKLEIEFHSNSVAPSVRGINIKNENLKASSPFTSIIFAIEIVVPLRETPGKIANI